VLSQAVQLFRLPILPTWPADAPPATAPSAVRWCLSTAELALGGAALPATRTVYLINVHDAPLEFAARVANAPEDAVVVQPASGRVPPMHARRLVVTLHALPDRDGAPRPCGRNEYGPPDALTSHLTALDRCSVPQTRTLW